MLCCVVIIDSVGKQCNRRKEGEVGMGRDGTGQIPLHI